MFVDYDSVASNQVGEGISRKILCCGGSLMMVEITFTKGTVAAIHTHPHEQVSYIKKGSLEFNLNGEKKILKEGDSVYVAPDTLHGVEILEEGTVVLDVFTPQREDFLVVMVVRGTGV